MRTDKQLPDETRAGEDALSTEDIANANPRLEREEREDDAEMPTHDMPVMHADDGELRDEDRTEDRTVMGTRVDGSDTMTEQPQDTMTEEEPYEEALSSDTMTEQAQDSDTSDTSDTSTEQPQNSEDDVPPTVELFPAQEIERFRDEWHEIQTRFVDDPRDAVRDADQLVAEVMRSLATTFTDHKHDLEGRWQQGDQVETEVLRQTLRQYRSFFNHLLEV